jgi:hypothetical protein
VKIGDKVRSLISLTLYGSNELDVGDKGLVIDIDVEGHYEWLVDFGYEQIYMNESEMELV